MSPRAGKKVVLAASAATTPAIKAAAMVDAILSFMSLSRVGASSDSAQ
jgi:hypothetical protein